MRINYSDGGIETFKRFVSVVKSPRGFRVIRTVDGETIWTTKTTVGIIVVCRKPRPRDVQYRAEMPFRIYGVGKKKKTFSRHNNIMIHNNTVY